MSFIIPAIDLIDGKCVRLSEGVYESSKVYADDPCEMAKRFAASGAKRLHLVDLDGARAGEPKNLALMEAIATATDLVVDFSGGLRSSQNIADAFSAGARLVSIGSAAVEQPELFCGWLEEFGAKRFILSADVRGEFIAVRGWERQTRVSLFSFLDELSAKAEIAAVTVTDIAKDGMLSGPSFALYKDLCARFPDLQCIASGGVQSCKDIEDLQALGLAGVIVGKALYEERIPLEALGRYQC